MIKLLRNVISLFRLLYHLPELEKRLSNLEQNYFCVTSIKDQLFIQQDCQHDYPNFWNGTVPPPCLKCGQPATNFSCY